MPRGLRSAQFELGADDRRLRSDLARNRGIMRRWATGVKADIGRTLRGTMSTALTIGGLGGIAGGVGVFRQWQGMQETADRLKIAMGANNVEFEKFRANLRGLSLQRGIGEEQILGAAAAYQALRGNAEETAEIMPILSDFANATGADLETLAKVAAGAADTMGLSGQQFALAMGAWAKQGKMGSVELKNMAAELPQLGASFGAFAGQKGVQGAEQLGAWMQVLAKGTQDSSEAATQLSALMGAMIQHADKLKKVGIDVLGQPLVESVEQILAKTKGNPILVQALIGDRKEANRAIAQFNVSGRSAFNSFLGTAQTGLEMLRNDQESYESSQSGRTKKALNELNARIMEKVAANADKIVTAVEKIVDLLVWAVDNPIATLMLLTGAKLGTGLASAVIGNALAGGATGVAANVATGAGGAGILATIAKVGGTSVAGAGAGAAMLTAGAGLAAGYGIGTVLDDWLGISDAWSGTGRYAEPSIKRGAAGVPMAPSGKGGAAGQADLVAVAARLADVLEGWNPTVRVSLSKFSDWLWNDTDTRRSPT
jgi:hypothetical protein